MSETEILAISRAFERPLIAFFCGMSIFMGYKLFQLGIRGDQKGSVSVAEWKVSLDRVGPGIFFALFGMIGLCFGVAQNFSYSSRNSLSNSSTLIYEGPAADRQILKQIKALNQIIDPLQEGGKVNTLELVGVIQQNRPYLQEIRHSLLLQKLQPSDLDFWEKNKDAFRSGTISDPSLLQRLVLISPYMEGSN